jgi:hypothetical protein
LRPTKLLSKHANFFAGHDYTQRIVRPERKVKRLDWRGPRGSVRLLQA